MDTLPELRPDHELPAPHDMQLPTPHLTQRYPWLHWLPAFFGLFIGMFVGIILFKTSDAEVKQATATVQATSTVRPTEPLQKINVDAWKTYKGIGYSFNYPPEWTPITAAGINEYKYDVLFQMKSDSNNASSTIQPVWQYEFFVRTLPRNKDIAIQEDIFISRNIINEAERNTISTSSETMNGITFYRSSTFPSIAGEESVFVDDAMNNRILVFTLSPINHKEPYENQGAALQKFNATIASLKLLQFAPTPVPVTKNVLNSNAVSCPAETKQCPDGSIVRRIGPQCDFAPCTTAQP